MPIRRADSRFRRWSFFLTVVFLVHQAALGQGSYTAHCFGVPNDQVPGNAPRFSANARGEGIRNTDMGFFKDFAVREGMKLELRAEFFNLTNSVRFRVPDSFLGDSNFGLGKL